MTAEPAVEDLLRELVPQVLGILVRRHGQFDACEDVVQDALLEAAVRWPEQGVPDNPRAWLLTVASHRLTDQWRSENARRRREVAVSIMEPPVPDTPDTDDTLTLLFLCCHPTLTEPAQLALTLRAIGGLTTTEIARAFLVPEATMAQRISRAKQRIRADGARFGMPPADQLGDRLRVVQRVLLVLLNQAVALAMVAGPRAGLELLGPLDADDRMAGHQRLAAVRAHLLEQAGDLDAAREQYRLAGRRTTSLPERRYLEARRRRL